MLNSALNTICEEHRSLASVVQGLQFLVRRYRRQAAEPDFALLAAIVGYLREFPAKRHHPKEDAYLFALLQKRTGIADGITAELRRQHVEESRLVEQLEDALEVCSRGDGRGMAGFARAAERFCEHVLRHIEFEEHSLLPIARHYLTAEDWVAIGEAFGENGDPRFSADRNQDYAELFGRLLAIALPAGGRRAPGAGAPRRATPPAADGD